METGFFVSSRTSGSVIISLCSQLISKIAIFIGIIIVAGANLKARLVFMRDLLHLFYGRTRKISNKEHLSNVATKEALRYKFVITFILY